MRQKEIQNQQIEGPNKKSSQIFINRDIHVPIDVLIKLQIFTNKLKVFFLIFYYQRKTNSRKIFSLDVRMTIHFSHF